MSRLLFFAGGGGGGGTTGALSPVKKPLGAGGGGGDGFLGTSTENFAGGGGGIIFLPCEKTFVESSVNRKMPGKQNINFLIKDFYLRCNVLAFP